MSCHRIQGKRIKYHGKERLSVYTDKTNTFRITYNVMKSKIFVYFKEVQI